jgi:membrane protein
MKSFQATLLSIPGPARIAQAGRDLVDLARYTLHRFMADRCQQVAASLTYTSLLALVPMMTVAFAIFAAFPVFADIREDLQTYIFRNFVPHVGDVVYDNLVVFADNAGKLTVVGVLFLGVTAFMLLQTIQSSFNGIWRVGEARPLLVRLLAYWALLSLGPLLFGASFSLSSYLFATARAVGVEAWTGPLARLTGLVPILLSAAGLCLMYNALPNFPVRWRHSVIGGLVAATLFELLKRAFTLYVANFPSYEAVYGALAAFPIFLVWSYLSWVVVLLGAELTASLPEWRMTRDRGLGAVSARRQIEVALDVLAALWAKSGAGGELRERELIAAVAARPDRIAKTLRDLAGAGVVARSERQGWLLARDLDRLTLYDLYRALGHGLADGAAPPQTPPAWGARLQRILADANAGERRPMSCTVRELVAAAPEPSEATARDAAAE